MTETIGAFFENQANIHAARPFLCVPRDGARAYYPDGVTLSYGAALTRVKDWVARLDKAGFGPGHRVAVLLENRPEMVLVKLALGTLGVSWVPVNPDYRPAEIAYLLQDSAPSLALCAPERADQMRAGIAQSGEDVPLGIMTDDLPDLPEVERRAGGAPDGESEASVIYTSGTTGRPKGCLMSHAYEIEMGQWYVNIGGEAAFPSEDSRIYNPLPLFHVNCGILTVFGAIELGGCLIVPERFSASGWWRDIAETRANVAHYLGIVIPALMNRGKDEWSARHGLKFAIGAGVEPTLHAPFEETFDVPLIEVWGMTEMCRILGDCHKPRARDKRAIGRPVKGLEVRVVDSENRELPRGTAGEMVLRHSAETPRRGAFSGYLNLPVVTEESWRGGWFHTGDTVTMDDSGLICFVDRQKNIIRRSGENIAAAEIEACLQEHAEVERVAVIAVEDALRDEEVMACVSTSGDVTDTLAQELFEWVFARLAYYKAPGWIVFLDEIPVTGTQKIQKHAMFAKGDDPTAHPTAHDFRSLKKRYI